MFDIFKHTLDTLTSSTEKWTTKTATITLIFFGLWFLNNTFDFTQSFRLNNKLQLEQLGQLIKDTTLTKRQIDILIKERDLVFERRTTLDKGYSLLDSFLDSLPKTNFIRRKTANKPKPSDEASNTSLTNKESESVDIVKKNYWLQLVSSNTILILIILFIPFSIPWDKGFSVIIGMLFILGILFLVCVFVSWIMDFIPVIANRPWINYIINFLTQLLFWLGIGAIAQKKQSTTPT